MTVKIPGRLGGNDPLVRWLNQLRGFIVANRVTSVQGGAYIVGGNGTQLIARPTVRRAKKK